MKPLAFLVALALAVPAMAAQAIAVSVEALARESHLVVRGRVDAVTARWSDDHRRIFTTASVRPSTALRGQAPSHLEVMVPGGVVGRTGQLVDAAPTFTKGEDVVLFLVREGSSWRVNGLAQGKLTVEEGTARPDLSKISFVAERVGKGERRVEAMPLAELERRVRSVQ